MTAPTKSKEAREQARLARAAEMAAMMQDLTDDTVTDEQVSQIGQVVREREERLAAAGAREIPIAEVKPSPYQPVGRPSRAAEETVRQALAAVGSLAALVQPEGEADAAAFTALSAEARELAMLAADIAANGIDSPLEARLKDGDVELLSGHRRLTAARLAGLATVPVVVKSMESDAEAALAVFRRNLHRADFRPWQQARRFADIRARRNAERAARGEKPETQRELAAALGFSLGMVNELIAIAAGFPDDLLTDLGNGSTDAAEQALAALPQAWLLETAKVKDRTERLVAARLKTRLGSAGIGAPSDDRPVSEGVPTPQPPAVLHRLKELARGKGLVLTVDAPIERLTLEQAEALKADLAGLRKRVDARLRELQAGKS